ncbi:nuclease [Nguyenibacter vanlangensis]|uniref:Nuclease n=1 Tax=Nguyenibacter vanlangensis TaxID=1216886 RepID=A0A7Y7IVQ3_9PROT|nr:nuclease [Nguyenibacter vanlangensis]
MWLILFGVVALVPRHADAWGVRAHALIDRAAIDALPDDGPVFLKPQRDLIARSASVPDTWRNVSEPFSKIAEDPNHGWFREQFAFMKAVPRSRYEFILALYKEYLRIVQRDPKAARRMNVRWTGTLPYAIVEGYGHLVADMRLIRMMRAQGTDTRALEADCAFFVAWMGHYVADGSQPLHVTIHHDGWVGPDPKGYTRDPAVHARFETRYVDMIGLVEADILPRMQPVGHLDGDVFDLVLAYLDRSYQYVETVYAFDKSGALNDAGNRPARALVYDRTAAAAAMLRDLVYRAWLESALPPRVLPNPIDPSNPDYDPETGSAPAARSPRPDHPASTRR